MKIGIAGAGNIVPTFCDAAQKVDGLDIQAICATGRRKEHVEQLAQRYGIPDVSFSYETMLDDDEIDGIYVAVPNHLHYEFAKQALQRGKSVICEKPFCLRAAETQALAALAERNRLFLFEAISNQYFPNYQKVRELLPELGEIKLIAMNFSQYSSRYDAFRRGEILPVFDAEKGGGALMDLNVYQIHFVVGLFGEPEGIQYYANMERGVDTSGTLILRYPGFICSLIAAKDCKAPFSIQIQGNDGCIHSPCASNSLEAFSLLKKDGTQIEYAMNREPERLYYELEAFAHMVEASDFGFCRERMQHSLRVQRVLEEAYRQSRMEKP